MTQMPVKHGDRGSGYNGTKLVPEEARIEEREERRQCLAIGFILVPLTHIPWLKAKDRLQCLRQGGRLGSQHGESGVEGEHEFAAE